MYLKIRYSEFLKFISLIDRSKLLKSEMFIFFSPIIVEILLSWIRGRGKYCVTVKTCTPYHEFYNNHCSIKSILTHVFIYPVALLNLIRLVAN